MFGTQDLEAVLRIQEQLRRDAAEQRLAARINRQESHKAPARRVVGLRISLA